ncbi:MAG TPA: flagellar biosynthesis protein FliC, partial [Rhodobacter sp.]|nr:flagellar biosynthesis protein FliC [Rhodobacter sp.]
EANSSGLTATVSGSGPYTVSFVQSDAAILGNLSDAIRAAKVPGVYMTENTTTPGTYSIDKHVFAATTAEEALSALTRIDNAITAVNDQRSALGAISNRLSYTVNNLTNIVTNLDMSRGRIEDADFALESANMARFQILQQASTAMLAQANAAKQDVLSLIK